jgi:hypothetical protein
MFNGFNNEELRVLVHAEFSELRDEKGRENVIHD